MKNPRVTFGNFALALTKLALTNENVDFILYYSNFGVILSSYSSHLLTPTHRHVLSAEGAFMLASFLDFLSILSPTRSRSKQAYQIPCYSASLTHVFVSCQFLFANIDNRLHSAT